MSLKSMLSQGLWLDPGRLGGCQGPTSQAVYELIIQILQKRCVLISITMIQSGHNLHMARQQSCRAMCKIVTWLLHYCTLESNLYIYENRNMGSLNVCKWFTSSDGATRTTIKALLSWGIINSLCPGDASISQCKRDKTTFFPARQLHLFCYNLLISCGWHLSSNFVNCHYLDNICIAYYGKKFLSELTFILH